MNVGIVVQEGAGVVVGIEAEEGRGGALLLAMDGRLGVLLVCRGPGRQLGAIGHVPLHVGSLALDQEWIGAAGGKSRGFSSSVHKLL